jgi:hypothetical protein
VGLTVATVVLVWVGLIPLTVLSAAEVCSRSRRRRQLRAAALPLLELDQPPRRHRGASACQAPAAHCSQDRRAVAAASAATCRGD